MPGCLIEYARDVAGMVGANSTEFDPDTKYPVVALITSGRMSQVRFKRSDKSNLGGTIRLGGQLCHLQPGSKVRELYGQDRHR